MFLPPLTAPEAADSHHDPLQSKMASQGAQVVKNPPANAGRHKKHGFDPWVGRSHGGGRGHPLQYSCLENPMDRGAWQAAVHRTQLK